MIDDLKRQAAVAAIEEIRDGMVVGLGTGSTAAHFIRELGRRVRSGMRVMGVPTSRESEELAVEVGVPLTTLRDHPVVDLTVDGADEVSARLDLIKGLGGALVREKVVAHASKRVVIVVDETKMVDKLGRKAPIPIEVVPFAAESVARQLLRWGGQHTLREKDGKPWISDNGNLILDWKHGAVDEPHILEKQIKAITGVVDSGIFSNVADLVIVATATALHRLRRQS